MPKKLKPVYLSDQLHDRLAAISHEEGGTPLATIVRRILWPTLRRPTVTAALTRWLSLGAPSRIARRKEKS